MSLAGRQGVSRLALPPLAVVSEFLPSLSDSAIYQAVVLSSVFARLLLIADFAEPMSLEMSLASEYLARVFGGGHIVVCRATMSLRMTC